MLKMNIIDGTCGPVLELDIEYGFTIVRCEIQYLSIYIIPDRRCPFFENLSCYTIVNRNTAA